MRYVVEHVMPDENGGIPGIRVRDTSQKDHSGFFFGYPSGTDSEAQNLSQALLSASRWIITTSLPVIDEAHLGLVDVPRIGLGGI